jgi:hypothetical protein
MYETYSPFKAAMLPGSGTCVELITLLVSHKNCKANECQSRLLAKEIWLDTGPRGRIERGES